MNQNQHDFAKAVGMAAQIYSDVELAFWLTAPQPLLKMWTPIQLLARGDADELVRILEQMEAGTYM